MQTDLVNRVCPLCEGDATTPLATKGNLRLVRCAKCSMIFANPVECKLASGLFYAERGTSFYLSRDKLESDHAPVRFQRELRLFRAYSRRGAVLDVGCSTGAFLVSLTRQFPGDYSVYGTDIVSAALDHAESCGIQVIRTPFLDFRTEGFWFDAVTFWAVMEHLIEPRKFLRKAASLLKSGGFCFILVPNMKSLAVRLLGWRYRYVMPDHVNYFTSATLRAFGQGCAEFEVVKLTATHFNPIVILKDFGGGPDRVPDAERSQLLKRTTAWKQSRWLQPLKLFYSTTERLLASLELADNLVIVLRKKSSGGSDYC